MNRTTLAAATVGGAIGAILVILVTIFFLPDVLSSRIVRQGLLSDPAILSETVEALKDTQHKPVLDANRSQIETPFAGSWKGAKDADVTIVEYYDYACPYCKSSNPILDRLIAEDKKVRVVYRELPILGPDSVTAARLSLAASKAGKFAQFHDTLWEAGRPSADTLTRAAAAAGISPEPTNDPAVEAELQRNFQMAGQLGATGTPLFVIGDRVINSAATYEQMKDAVAKARAGR